MQEVLQNTPTSSSNLGNPEKEVSNLTTLQEKRQVVQPSDSKEESKMAQTPEVTKKRRYRKKKVQDKLTIFQKELEDKWKMIFVFDPHQLLTMKAKKKMKEDDLNEFLHDLNKKMEEHQIENLDHFSLNLKGCQSFTDDGLGYLSSHLSSTLKGTRFLDLNFYHCKITDQGLEKLNSQIGVDLHDLEHLSLSFLGCNRLGKDGFQSLSSELLAKCPNLTSFGLTPSLGGGLNGKDLIEIIEALSTYQKNLQHLELNVEHFSFKDETLAKIGSIIGAGMPSLQSLVLDFKCWHKITDRGLIEFVQHLGENLPQLQNLDLNFTRCQLSDQSLEALSAYLLPKLKALKNLALKFDGCPKMTNAGASKLIQSITTHLLRIEHLNLNLNGLFTITDEDLNEVSILIGANLKLLKSLKLGLAGSKITDQGVSNLFEILGNNLKSLEELSLNLSGCKDLTDKGIRQFGISIVSHFKSLKNLELIFNNSKQISESTKKFLHQSLKPISHVNLIIS